MSESNNNIPMRITQLQEATEYEEGMYYAVAKAGSGTKKIAASIVNDKIENIVEPIIVKNLANSASVIYGKYYANIGGYIGIIDTDNNTGIIDKIKLLKNHTYYITFISKSNIFCHFAKLDDTYIGDMGTYTTNSFNRYTYTVKELKPEQDCYLCLSISSAESAKKIMVCEGFLPLASYPYNEIITVLYDGIPQEDFVDECNLDSFVYATLNDSFIYISSVIRDNWHWVRVKIGTGTYYVTSEITLPNNVIIEGENAKDSVISFTPTDTSDQAIEANSLFRLEQNAEFNNVTLKAVNARYVVHAESANNYKNWTVKIKNCIIEHLLNTLGNWQSQHAWGEGASSGSRLYATNTTFITHGTASQNAGFSVHNNTNFDDPMYHEFVNCRFLSPKSKCSFRCEGLASGQNDECVLIGCELEGNIYNVNSQTIEIICIGCNIVPTNASSYFSKNSIAYYREYTRLIYNNTGNTIPAGTIVAYNELYSLKKANEGDLVIGFTIGDTVNNDYALVITKGFYRLVDGSSFGTRYRVDNGSLVADNDGKTGLSVSGGFVYVNGVIN